MIRALAKLGLVWNIWQPSREMMEKWAVKSGER